MHRKSFSIGGRVAVSGARRRALLAAPLLAASALLTGSCGQTQEERGGLMLIIAKDEDTTLDEVRVRVVDESGKQVLARSFPLSDSVQLPATFGLVSNGKKDASVGIRVSGWAEEKPVDVRDVFVSNVPVTVTKEVRVLLSARCSSLVKLDAQDEAVTTCDDPKETCQPTTGMCARIVDQDAATFDEYVPGNENKPATGGSSGTGGAHGSGGNEPGSGGSTGGSGTSGTGGDGTGGDGTPGDVCEPNESTCDVANNKAVTCNAAGTGYLSGGQKCSSTQTCFEGACENHECEPNQTFCSNDTVRKCAANGLSSSQTKTCAAGTEYCDPTLADCEPGLCAPNQPTCEGNVARLCNTDGSGYQPGGTPCQASQSCDAGVCKPWVCQPNQLTCVNNAVNTCAANGLSSSNDDCPSNKTCVSGVCSGVCGPSQPMQCLGQQPQKCNGYGQWADQGAACAANKTCSGGQCIGECGPGQGKCVGQQPQTCGSTGLWQNNGSACSGMYACAAGSCASVVWALWPMPNPASLAGSLPNPASYDLGTPGVVKDNVTDLWWERNVVATTYDWAGAKAHCETMTLAGYSDWRLPSRIELVSIYDFTKSYPAIDTAVFGASYPAYWTSSLYAGDSSSAWYMNDGPGALATGLMTGKINVRCVR